MTQQPDRQWDFNPPRFRWRIAGLHALGFAALAGACATGLALGAVTGLQALAIALAAYPAGKAMNYFAHRQGKGRRGAMSFPGRNIQMIGEALFKNAGLISRPLIFFHTRLHEDNNYLQNAYIDLTPEGENRNFLSIYLGEHLYNQLDNNERTAILAHETGHAINKPPELQAMTWLNRGAEYALYGAALLFNPAFSLMAASAWGIGHALPRLADRWNEEKYEQWGKRIKRFGIAGSILCANPVLALLAGSATVINRISHKAAGRYDEDRADRNALYLYPHPTALRTIFAKAEFPEAKPQELLRTKAHYDFLTRLRYITAYDHTDFDQRMKLAVEFYREADNFYRANGMSTKDVCAAIEKSADEKPSRPRAASVWAVSDHAGPVLEPSS